MSFQIDFPEITDELDYNMASHAWQLSHNVDCNNDKEKWALVFLGENLLVGTFILVRLGGEEQLPALIAEIFSQWLSQTNECHHLIRLPSAQQYFVQCVASGKNFSSQD